MTAGAARPPRIPLETSPSLLPHSRSGRILSFVRFPLPPTHAVMASLLVSLVASQVHAKLPGPAMSTHRSAHFELTSACDTATRGRIVSHLETFHSVLEVLVPAATGVQLGDTPIRVLLYEEPSDYHTHVRRHAPRLGHNGGYYDGATRTVVAHRRANPLHLQFHEITHAALGDVFEDPHYNRYSRPGWPVWFDEGFAEYVSSFEIVPEGLKFGAPHLARIATLADAIDRRQALSVSDVLRARPTDFSGRRMDLYYATAWGMVDLLLAEPDLRIGVPKWVTRLRAGEDGVLAFRDIFGGDMQALQRRLYHRIRTLASQPTATRTLAPQGKLEPWTAHDGGHWWSEGTALVGQSTTGWSYLTTAVPLTSRYAVTLDVASSRGANLGLVLGRHAAGAYPYHTLIAFDGREIAIRRVDGPEHVETLVTQPLHLTGQRWASVRIRVDQSILLVSVDGRDVLAARLDAPASSLFGLYVERGTARFRAPTLRPVSGRPTGPSEPSPPEPVSHDD